MLTYCRLSYRAEVALREELHVPPGAVVEGAEIEFKELPYFLVSRSRAQWDPEKYGDINTVYLSSMVDRGLMIDPEVTQDGKTRLTMIPWSNVISLTVLYDVDGSTE